MQTSPTPAGVDQGDINTTTAREAFLNRHVSEKTRRLLEEDAAVFLHQSLSTPVMNAVAAVEGAYVIDTEGRRYLDFHGNGVHNAGFNHPKVLDAIRGQLDSGLTFCPRRYTNEAAVAAAKKLVSIAPEGMTRVLFCPGGSEANEMALMLARQVTGNFKSISYWESFHGAGFMTASVGGDIHFRGGAGPLMPGALHVEYPDYYRNPWGFEEPERVDAECLRQMELLFHNEAPICAVIGEPVFATPRIPSKAYWQGVRDLCDRHGAFLIFDEVIEGLGRTGTMLCSEHFATPDVITLGKSLGGGLVPWAGIITHEKYNTVRHRSIGHFTHEKNALCCAAALAEIEALEEERMVENAATLGAYVLDRLHEMQERHPLIGHVAGLGLHFGIDLVKDRETKQRAKQEAEAVMYKCLERGLSFKTIEGNILTLRPALCITKDELDQSLEILEESIGEVEAEG